MMSETTVYLIGAGPGDAGLLTMRGHDLLGAADIVVYDYLAHPLLLEGVRDDAEKIYVGKKGFDTHITQDEINDLIIDAARRLDERGGGIVVRLKGGDPFVFGRGGEEALALERAAVPFEIVPGVTSGVAAAAYAGIPVTHRGLSSSVTFVTGHEDPTKKTSSIDWRSLARLVRKGGTVCFYMGMRNLPEITGNLIEKGAGSDTPAAVIQWGTLPAQRTLVAPLLTLADEAVRAKIEAPAIILVGRVACLREELMWFEKRPLFGRRIVVTRSRTQASGLVSRLTALGADVVEFPTIEIAPLDDYALLDRAQAMLDRYDWLVFTSVNGVDAFFERLDGDARLLAGLRVAAIGPATAGRLLENGIKADVVPDEYRGEAVYDAMAAAAEAAGSTPEGMRVLVARALEARETLPALLERAGASVDVVPVYRTCAPKQTRVAKLADQLEAGKIDAVTFSSSSTARNLVAMLGDRAQDALAQVDLFSIGPITSSTLADAGLAPVFEAREYTIPGLVEALVNRYGAREGIQ